MKTNRKLFEDQVVIDTHSLEKLLDEMVRTNFFLPPDVLSYASIDWDVQPITLCKHEEWLKSQQYMLDYGAIIKYENGSKLLVAAAKTVAVSVRRHRSLNEWLVLARPWLVGEIPVHEFNRHLQFPLSQSPHRKMMLADAKLSRGV